MAARKKSGDVRVKAVGFDWEKGPGNGEPSSAREASEGTGERGDLTAKNAESAKKKKRALEERAGLSPTLAHAEIVAVPWEWIVPCPHNRRHWAEDDAKDPVIVDLAESILRHGRNFQAIIVRQMDQVGRPCQNDGGKSGKQESRKGLTAKSAKSAEGGGTPPAASSGTPLEGGSGNGEGLRFEIAAGECRWRAVRLLNRKGFVAGKGWDAGTAPGVVWCEVRVLSDEQMFEICMAENAKRKNLSPLEEAETLEAYLSHYSGWTLDQAAAQMGMSRFAAARRMRLTALAPGWREAIADRELDFQHWPMGCLEKVAALPEAVQVEVLEHWGNEGVPNLLDDLRRQLGEHFAMVEGFAWMEEERGEITNCELRITNDGTGKGKGKEVTAKNAKNAKNRELGGKWRPVGMPRCLDCGKRSGCQPDLFDADDFAYEGMRGYEVNHCAARPGTPGDRCLDGRCRREKTAAWMKLAVERARKEHAQLRVVKSGNHVLDEAFPKALYRWGAKEVSGPKAKGAFPGFDLATGKVGWWAAGNSNSGGSGTARNAKNEKKEEPSAAEKAAVIARARVKWQAWWLACRLREKMHLMGMDKMLGLAAVVLDEEKFSMYPYQSAQSAALWKDVDALDGVDCIGLLIDMGVEGLVSRLKYLAGERNANRDEVLAADVAGLSAWMGCDVSLLAEESVAEGAKLDKTGQLEGTVWPASTREQDGDGEGDEMDDVDEKDGEDEGDEEDN